MFSRPRAGGPIKIFSGDVPAPPPRPRFAVGDPVRHPSYGPGTVTYVVSPRADSLGWTALMYNVRWARDGTVYCMAENELTPSPDLTGTRR